MLLDLFKVRSYGFGTAIGLVYFAGFTAIFFILTLYLQNGRGYRRQAGLAVTSFARLGRRAALGGRSRPVRPVVGRHSGWRWSSSAC